MSTGRQRANCRSCQTLKVETCIVLKFRIDKGVLFTDPARCHGCHLRVFKYYVSSGKGRSQGHFTIYHLYLLSLFQFFQKIPRYRDVLAFGAGVLQEGVYPYWQKIKLPTATHCCPSHSEPSCINIYMHGNHGNALGNHGDHAYNPPAQTELG